MNKQYYVQGDKPNCEPYHYTECGLDNIYLRSGFEFSEFEGEQYVSISNIEGLHKRIALDIVCQRKVIAGAEIRFLRSEAELTQAALAEYLRVTDQQVANCEKGKSNLTGGADVALRFFFLSRDLLQPEGNEIIADFFEHLREMARKDAAQSDNLLFEFEDEAKVWAGHPGMIAQVSDSTMRC